MKNLMIVFIAISLMAFVGCSKGSNPVSSDPVTPTPPAPSPVVFTASNVLPAIPAGWTLTENAIGVEILKGDGTDFVFLLPNGGTRTFTGDSAKLFAGKYTNIGPVVQIVQGNKSKYFSINPPGVIIPATVALPDTNQAHFVITIAGEH